MFMTAYYKLIKCKSEHDSEAVIVCRVFKINNLVCLWVSVQERKLILGAMEARLWQEQEG